MESQQSKQLPKEVTDTINQYLDEKSIYWENIKEKISASIVKHMLPRPKTAKENLIFFLRHTPLAAFISIFNYAFQAMLLYVGFSLCYPLPYIKCFGIWIVLRGIRNGIYKDGRADHITKKEVKP